MLPSQGRGRGFEPRSPLQRNMDYKHTNLPIEMKPKLVRDKIPEIIEKAEGVKAIIITLNKKDYGERLVEKIREEAEELLLAIKDNTNSIEELADILELINAIAIYVGGSISDEEKERKKKFKIRGGFKKRYLLLGKASE